MGKQILARTLFMILIGTQGCNSGHENSAAPPPSSNTEHPDNHQNAPEIVFATGWAAMVITANLAKTEVGVGAHFTTTRNACGKDAYGALSLEDWNNFATQANIAVQGLSQDPDYCVPLPEDDYLTRGGLSVDIKLPHETRTLYEVRGDQICSSIQNHQASDALLKAISNVISAADKEDCPNGWGS